MSKELSGQKSGHFQRNALQWRLNGSFQLLNAIYGKKI